MGEYDPTEFEIQTLEPESMGVGKLNRVVRELRERLYQAKLLSQEERRRAAKWVGDHAYNRYYCSGCEMYEFSHEHKRGCIVGEILEAGGQEVKWTPS